MFTEVYYPLNQLLFGYGGLGYSELTLDVPLPLTINASGKKKPEALFLP
jgi:hypothetical protein